MSSGYTPNQADVLAQVLAVGCTSAAFDNRTPPAGASFTSIAAMVGALAIEIDTLIGAGSPSDTYKYTVALAAEALFQGREPGSIVSEDYAAIAAEIVALAEAVDTYVAAADPVPAFPDMFASAIVGGASAALLSGRFSTGTSTLTLAAFVARIGEFARSYDAALATATSTEDLVFAAKMAQSVWRGRSPEDVLSSAYDDLTASMVTIGDAVKDATPGGAIVAYAFIIGCAAQFARTAPSDGISTAAMDQALALATAIGDLFPDVPVPPPDVVADGSLYLFTAAGATGAALSGTFGGPTADWSVRAANARALYVDASAWWAANIS